MIDHKALCDAIRVYAQPGPPYAPTDDGRHVVAYTIDRQSDLLESVAQIVGAVADATERNAVAHAFGVACVTTRHARGVVVYFPLVAWPSAEEAAAAPCKGCGGLNGYHTDRCATHVHGGAHA